MDKKMTSGEIAKKAGISQKAVRLYDEKGLLKPSDYTEGNYRLYDKEALLVLEKIIALKRIGFSLEEIHDNLIAEKSMDIKQSLNKQLELMEAKKCEIERTIGCIKSVLVRCSGEPDWNSVAEIARMIQTDQVADKHHFDALKHTTDSIDWYVKIYHSLGIKRDARVLDLGCGYGKLWRNNWNAIPAGVIVDGVDLHGSWADDFEGYLAQNKETLAEESDISIKWNDIEDEETWNVLNDEKPYTYVIAHYLLGFLKSEELLVQRASEVLSEGGMFSCNAYEVRGEHLFWKQALDAMHLNSGFIADKISEEQSQQDEFRLVLEKYFKSIEMIEIQNNMCYEEEAELFERLSELYPDRKKYFSENEKKIKEYFAELIMQDGEVMIATNSQFWHCFQ